MSCPSHILLSSIFFFFTRSGDHRHLHSFPTRRSSDLFSIDAAGAWSYTADSAHNEFEAGQTYTDTFTVSSADGTQDRKSTRLNSSHVAISYAVFCLKKKKKKHSTPTSTYHHTLHIILN